MAAVEKLERVIGGVRRRIHELRGGTGRQRCILRQRKKNTACNRYMRVSTLSQHNGGF